MFGGRIGFFKWIFIALTGVWKLFFIVACTRYGHSRLFGGMMQLRC